MGADGQIKITIPVTNTGTVAGAETVQLYIHDKESSLERPYKELKAFRKVFLEPGESSLVSLTIDRRALSFYDDKAQKWMAEPGEFEALIGNSSGNITSKCPFKLK